MSTDNVVVYKIFRPAEWAAFRTGGAWAGSPDDTDDGFIHLSRHDQIAGTLEKHFSSDPGLVLAAFGVAALGDELKWETSHGGAFFPHLYGVLDADAMLWHQNLPDDATGRSQNAIAALIGHMAAHMRAHMRGSVR